MVLLWLLSSLIFIALFEMFNAEIVPFIKGWFGLPKPSKQPNYFWLSFSLFSQINMEGCLAAAIKLGKISFIKQKEIDLLKNEKIKLQTEKDKTDDVQPVFLTDIMKRIETMIAEKPMNIPDAFKKIRNLMTYAIYEKTNVQVELKKELELLTEYIELEQYTRENVIDVNLSVSGDTEQESIRSFILLQCIQNAFNHVADADVEIKKIDIYIKVFNRLLDMSISWNKPLYTSTLFEGKNIILQNLSNRLKLIYPESHEIKFLIEAEKIIVSLKIDLKGAIN